MSGDVHVRFCASRGVRPPGHLTGWSWCRAAQGVGRPETFDFLGFTHICGKGKNGSSWLRRRTIAKRLRVKLKQVKDQLVRRRHLPVPDQGRWLASVVRGHLA
jgi:RNA-directed DNA polymerase